MIHCPRCNRTIIGDYSLCATCRYLENHKTLLVPVKPTVTITPKKESSKQNPKVRIIVSTKRTRNYLGKPAYERRYRKLDSYLSWRKKWSSGYRADPANKEKIYEWIKKYRESTKGREKIRAYRNSPTWRQKALVYKREYNRRPEVMERNRINQRNLRRRNRISLA